MYYPQEKEFEALAGKGNLIPVWREILADLETPVSAFIKLGQGKFSYLLESVEKGEQLGRYSFLGSDPVLVFKSKRERIEIIRQGKSEILRVEKDPLDALKKIMAGYKTVNSAELPRFSGGAIGYVGYDMVRFWEEIHEKNRDDLNLPDSLFMLSHTLVIFDHINHTIKVVSYAILDGKESP
ncbi:MAG: anthranilate synthase component I, partial [Clostridia bacterium]|nr:anthranilate synthase component I [Clostridia bacterium]